MLSPTTLKIYNKNEGPQRDASKKTDYVIKKSSILNHIEPLQMFLFIR